MAHAPSSQTLSTTIAAADDHVTILDVKADVENDAIFHWLKAHRIWSQHGKSFALATDPALPQAWRNKAIPFKTAAEATSYLDQLRMNPSTLIVLAAVAGPAPAPKTPPPAPPSLLGRNGSSANAPAHKVIPPKKSAKDKEDELLSRVAPLLVTGTAWVIPVVHDANPWVGNADPAVLAQVNTKLGTKVDFAFLGKYEGGQWRRGYVPIRRATGRVVGASGMTIATGFDIGQWAADDLTDTLKLTPVIADKLKLFTQRGDETFTSAPPAAQIGGKPAITRAVPPTGNFKNMTKMAVAKIVADTAPVPELTKSEADQVDAATHYQILQGAQTDWDKRSGKSVPSFTQLPGGWQTVIMSRFFQQGPRFATAAPGKIFLDLALKGDWNAAMTSFDRYSSQGSFSQYAERLKAEAALLRAEVPAALPAAPVK